MHFSLCWLRQKKFEIEISVPAGSTEAFVYSNEEIRPTGNKITIWSGAGLGDTEVILKPVNENVETGYVAEYLTHGVPVKFDTSNVKSEWFKIGIAVQNDSDKGPIAVSVEVEGVEVRIPNKANQDFFNAVVLEVNDDNSKILTAPAKKNVQKIETSDLGVTLTAKNVTSKGLTLVCEQSGVEVIGELFTGSAYTLSKYVDGEWKDVEYLKRDEEIATTDEAWIIPMEGSVEWSVDWEWLYGELPQGKYRLEKDVMNLTEPGKIETAMHFVEFDVAK